MRRYISLLLFIGLAFWSCEEEQEPKDCAGVAGGDNICGCTDSTVNNYDSTATFDDGSCEDCAGVAGGDNICGCTDSTATNYDSTATFDDESCEYDETPPTLLIESPTSGETYTDQVYISVITQDSSGVSKVEFYANDVLKFTDEESPYEYNWNTQDVSNGQYSLRIVSYDVFDNSTTETVTIVIYHPIGATEICDNQYSNVDGTLIACDEDCFESDGECYHINDLGVLEDFQQSFDSLSDSILLHIGDQLWVDGRLVSLDLSESNLSGEIPNSIGSLSALEQLYLNDNQLTGEIPSEIGNLFNLTYLDLSENQLTGEIPPEIGNLSNLTYLLLNDNQFAGEIPESICDLTVNFTDNHFDISHNSLCPPYPSCLENIYPGTQPGCYGSISVNVSFSGTWPDSGVVLMSLDTSYPSQGPPAASSNVTNDDLSNGIYNHTFTSLPFRTYEAILITYWPDGYTPAGTYLLIGSHLDIIYLFVDNYQVTIDAIFPE